MPSKPQSDGTEIAAISSAGDEQLMEVLARGFHWSVAAPPAKRTRPPRPCSPADVPEKLVGGRASDMRRGIAKAAPKRITPSTAFAATGQGDAEGLALLSR